MRLGISFQVQQMGVSNPGLKRSRDTAAPRGEEKLVFHHWKEEYNSLSPLARGCEAVCFKKTNVSGGETHSITS